MPHQARVAKGVRITRVEKAHSSYGGLRFHFLLGMTRLSVCVDSEDFSQRTLKRAIATELAREFAFRQARRSVGEIFSIDDLLREYSRKGDFIDLF